MIGGADSGAQRREKLAAEAEAILAAGTREVIEDQVDTLAINELPFNRDIAELKSQAEAGKARRELLAMSGVFGASFLASQGLISRAEAEELDAAKKPAADMKAARRKTEVCSKS